MQTILIRNATLVNESKIFGAGCINKNGWIEI